jgi:U3 small nucleolar RNA-associated protein 13
MSKAIVKTTFEASRTLRPIYTGGSTALDASGRILLSCVGEDALIVDLETGNQLTSLEGVCFVALGIFFNCKALTT